MYQNIKIKDLDHFGNGIAYINDKIVFIKNALPGEIVDIEIMETHKKYDIAKVLKYIEKSPKRKISKCKYFDACGGCNLLFYDYNDTLEFKVKKVKELIAKNKLEVDSNIEVIKNEHDYEYRNKISLKIVNGKLGFYEENSHNLVEIKKCMIANREINKVIENYKLLNIQNGLLTVRTNNNNEILLIIKTDESINIEIDKLKKIIKLVGIVYNDKTIYGDNFLYERIGGYLFKVSYNSFFQVNPYITLKLFNFIADNIKEDSKVVDLYSGVGTLGIVASAKAKEVISVEVIENAILNGIHNAKINKRNNIKFMLGDVSKVVDKIKNDFDTLIIDPPRKGLDKKTIDFIKNKKPQNIIYISCDVNTLMRDLKNLESIYKIKDYKILDMFSYSYHLESFVVLEKMV